MATQVTQQDKSYRGAAHLSVRECELLLTPWSKKMATLQRHLAKIITDSEGSTKYQSKIDAINSDIAECEVSIKTLNSIIQYHNESAAPEPQKESNPEPKKEAKAKPQTKPAPPKTPKAKAQKPETGPGKSKPHTNLAE